MTFELRPYQKKALALIIPEIIDKQKALASLCVGFGKTALMAEICRLAKGTVLITVPRISLIEQTVEKIKWVTDDVGIYCASLNKKESNKKIVVSTLQSIRNCEAFFHTIIIDECHLMEKSIEKTLIKIQHKNVLGLTGTPFLSGNIYGDDKYWNEPCATKSILELTELGFLTPLVLSKPSGDCEIDISDVSVQSGDYNLGELYEKYKDVIDDQVKDALLKTHDRKAVLWVCINIEHAETVGHLIGETARVIHSKKEGTLRVIDRFKNGKFKHLVSVSQISTGFDAPIADALVLMRATRSRTLFVQTVGRVLRVSDGKKDSLLLDYGRVVENLGDPLFITSSDSVAENVKYCAGCEKGNSATAIRCKFCDDYFYVMCSRCFIMNIYGEVCVCAIEAEKKRLAKIEEERFTREAYVKPSPWKALTHFKTINYTSKSGNDCLRVDYYNGIFNKVHSEYFSWGGVAFIRWLHANNYTDDYMSPFEYLDRDDIEKKCPSEILLVRDGKYNRIASRRF